MNSFSDNNGNGKNFSKNTATKVETNFWRLGVTDKIFSTLVALSRRSKNTRKFTATKVENNFLHYAEAPKIILHLSCNVEKVEKWRSAFQNLP